MIQNSPGFFMQNAGQQFNSSQSPLSRGFGNQGGFGQGLGGGTMFGGNQMMLSLMLTILQNLMQEMNGPGMQRDDNGPGWDKKPGRRGGRDDNGPGQDFRPGRPFPPKHDCEHHRPGRPDDNGPGWDFGPRPTPWQPDDNGPGWDRPMPAPMDPKPIKPDHDCDEGWKVDKGGREIELDNGYKLSFENKSQAWTVTDADGNKSRIWGDPHVDEDGDGKTDWDFKQNSTFMLKDGTKITVDTRDLGNGTSVSDRLTITKDDKAIVVNGIADNKVQISDVMQNGESLDDVTNDGYVFREGDGGVDDWLDDKGNEIKSNQAMGARRFHEE